MILIKTCFLDSNKLSHKNMPTYTAEMATGSNICSNTDVQCVQKWTIPNLDTIGRIKLVIYIKKKNIP
jgi:hypothetical protein